MGASKELAIRQQDFTPAGLQLELEDFINADKDRIKTIANKAYNSVMDGEADAVDTLIFIKKGSELFKELDAKIRPVAESKPIGKGYVKFGVKVDEAMAGVGYDYSQTGDIEYQQLNEVFEAAKAAVEARKTFLKAVTKPIEMVNTDTGETYTIHPPIKSGKLGLKLTIK
jgi:hypothetical protein